ncbi:hypothetical protein RJ639_035517 [Escallonia herrerae]|uniref:GAG-pre-integrase domain-containing protein n=1 Tax=Escallonia herrerae TaxID=1293975 RepID=A0AA88WPH9_9ASTE|nr:hypothetical protein RJ639_035517 [Escallonia herrerae]
MEAQGKSMYTYYGMSIRQRMKMRDVLIQQGLLKALKGNQGLPEMMFADEKEDMLERAHSALLLDWFATYRSFDGGNVHMGNDVSCKGSTVTGAVAVAVAASSDIDSNTTKLWHMRLGHMSEKSMDVLSNKVSSTAIDCKTPEEVWSSKHANNKNLRIFDCPAYAHVNDGKFEPRAKKCIFLGFASGVKGYRLWCPDSKSSREKVELKVQALDSLPIIPTDEEDCSHCIEENEKPQEQQNSIARNKSRREIRPPQKYGYPDMFAYALSVA